MASIPTYPANIGQDFAQFRSEVEATQSQLATQAGVDQSRISRIEKGEPGAPNELARILSGLEALGSKRATEYSAFLNREWQHIERPEFSNPQRHILELAEEALSQYPFRHTWCAKKLR